MSIMSHEVISTLRFLCNDNRNDSRQTTAWFISVVRHWFDLMANRKMSSALSKCDTEKYKETINFLNEVIVLFRDLSVGDKNQRKPFQAAVVLSTKSIIDLVEHLINDYDSVSFNFAINTRLYRKILFCN